MNCPNCSKPVENKIIDNVEYVECETCGFLRIEKDGSATALASAPGGWAVSLGGKDCPEPAPEEQGTKPAEAAEQTPGEPVKDVAKQDSEAGRVQPEPAELLDRDDDDGDSIDVNLHIEAEDD